MEQLCGISVRGNFPGGGGGQEVFMRMENLCRSFAIASYNLHVLSLTHSHTHTLSLTHTLTHTLSLTHTHIYSEGLPSDRRCPATN